MWHPAGIQAYPISEGVLFAGTICVLALAGWLLAVVGLPPRRILTWLRTHWRLTALYSVVVLVGVHLLFLAPPPKHGTQCVETDHPFIHSLSFTINCDSLIFEDLARHPQKLAARDQFFQDRPLQPLVAALLTRVEDPGGERSPPHPGPCRGCLERLIGYPYGSKGQPGQPGWLPYVFINFLELVVALILFDRLLRGGTRFCLPVLLLGLLLIFNEPVKNFFWSAHTQMWNVLMPLLSIAACAALVRQPARGWRYMGALGLLIGIGALAYASVVVIAPAVVLAEIVGCRLKHVPVLTRRFGLSVVLLAAGTIGPFLAWASLVRAVSGGFLDAATKYYGEYVWISHALRLGGLSELLHQTEIYLGFLHQPASYYGQFAPDLFVMLWPALLILVFLAEIGYAGRVRWHDLTEARRDVLVGVGATLLICLPFFALQGFYRDRLEFNFTVPVIVTAGLAALEIRRLTPRRSFAVAVNVVLAIGAAAYIVTALTKPGHYI